MSGNHTSISIREQLRHPELQMDTFFSQDGISAGHEIAERILTDIVDSDLLICVVDQNSKISEWVKWEHRFCKERNIRIINVISYVVWSDFKENKIDFLDTGILAIELGKNLDSVLGEIYKAVKAIKLELDNRKDERDKIQINANTNSTTYSEQDTVIIKGNVTNSGLFEVGMFNICNAYVHKPNVVNEPPISNIISEPITLDKNGNFEIKYKIENHVTQNQKWFIEIRFNNKSRILPITILPNNGRRVTNVTDVNPPHEDTRSRKTTWLEKLKVISLGTFQSIPKTINNYTIARKEEFEYLSNQVQQYDRVVIVGNKGVGKSVMLSHLYKELNTKNEDVLFLRCDDYLNMESLEQLQKIIDSEYNIEEIISKTFSSSHKLIVILDSLDSISRNTKTIGIFKEFLKILWGTNKVKTICSVRKYDYEYSALIKNRDWGMEFDLGNLSEKQLYDALSYLKKPKISHHLEDILKNPLHLKLLSMILIKSPNADFTQITNEVELYNEHWKEYVEKSNHSRDIKKILFSMSEKMIENQRIVIPYGEFQSKQGIQDALSTGIVELDINSGFIQFFHHAYLDYVISRYVILNYENFAEFLSKEDYNIFLRPTIIFTLSILHNQNVTAFMKNVNHILSSALKYYWKISALHAIAKIKDLQETDVKEFGALLDSDYLLHSHFLHEITKEKNPHWFKIWKDTIFKKWFENQQYNDGFLIEYVRSIVDFQQFHSEIFDMIKSLVLKSKDSWTQKMAIETTAKLKSIDRFDWYLQLSKHENSYVRWGVLDCLSNLIETEPKNIHQIFENIFTYQETSDDKTMLPTYGSLIMTSNKRQDNHQIIWMAGEIFPKLLEKNPREMILATIGIIEFYQKPYLEKQQGSLIEDGGYIWYDVGDFRGLHDENILLSSVENYLQKSERTEFEELLPTLTKTRLATIRRIVLRRMLNDPAYFRDNIFQEIVTPGYLTISTLEPVILGSLEKLSRMFDIDQIKQLLNLIMNIEFPRKHDDPKAIITLNRIKARFLSKISSERLGREHKELLEKFQKEELKYEPPVSIKIEVGKPPENIPKPIPEKVIEEKIGKQLDRRERIELFEAMVEYLGKKTEELDKSKLKEIENQLLSHIDDPDPSKGAIDDDPNSMGHRESIRGIVSRGLIRLYYHTKDNKFEAPIRKLSNDPTNIVRGEVARELRYLFFVNYPLTVEIATRYSKEHDYRIHFFLSDIISVIASKQPNDAIALIKNIFSLNKLKNFKQIQFHEDVIMYLALVKKIKDAKTFLDEILDSTKLSNEILQNIPFILKERYLFDDKTQDAALSILLKLLDKKDNQIREKATFFLLYPLIDMKKAITTDLITKISPHLDKIAFEIERDDWDLRIIEELFKFLERYWKHVPEKTINFLEKVTGAEKKYLTFQPQISRDAIIVLNGVFREPSLPSETRKICINILDKFTKAGWPEAISLLESMERPD